MPLKKRKTSCWGLFGRSQTRSIGFLSSTVHFTEEFIMKRIGLMGCGTVAD